MTPLTPSEKEALEKAYQLLGEHFEASLIVVTTLTESDGRNTESSRVYWSGGYQCAIGHAESAKHMLLSLKGVTEVRPGED